MAYKFWLKHYPTNYGRVWHTNFGFNSILPIMVEYGIPILGLSVNAGEGCGVLHVPHWSGWASGLDQW